MKVLRSGSPRGRKVVADSQRLAATPPAAETPRAADQTRLALLHAGLTLFGEKGFEATSTREIAARAEANIGSIAYHFGGKDGLREACARHLVETLSGVAGPVILAQTASLGPGPEAARKMLDRALETMVGFLVSRPEAGTFVRFVLRELSQPSPALDIIYGGLFEPMHKRLCEIWAQATGMAADSEETMLAVFSMIGQVVYFRIGQEAVMRRLGWSAMTQANAAKISEITRFNLDAILSARKGGPA